MQIRCWRIRPDESWQDKTRFDLVPWLGTRRNRRIDHLEFCWEIMQNTFLSERCAIILIKTPGFSGMPWVASTPSSEELFLLPAQFYFMNLHWTLLSSIKGLNQHEAMIWLKVGRMNRSGWRVWWSMWILFEWNWISRGVEQRVESCSNAFWLCSFQLSRLWSWWYQCAAPSARRRSWKPF
jgi:hypothetical protein